MVAFKKNICRKIINKRSKKTTNAMEKKITELHNRLNPSGPGKRMNLSRKKTLEDLYSNAKNLYIIRRRYNK